jgi:hypothetical protein
MRYKPDQPSERKFLLDIKNHVMTVLRDDGADRHIRFRQPQTSNAYFDLITWPGSLCFTGDMGTFVFSRIADMFEFFRDEKPDGHLRINTGYWAEKLDAADRRTGGYEKFSPEKFVRNVKRYAKDSGASRAVMRAITDRVLTHAEDGEPHAYAAACGFQEDGFSLRDFYEINCREYTYHFVWCCYAIVWGIRQYDQQSKQEAA